MTQRTTRRINAALKAKIALEALQQATVADPAQRYQVHRLFNPTPTELQRAPRQAESDHGDARASRKTQRLADGNARTGSTTRKRLSNRIPVASGGTGGGLDRGHREHRTLRRHVAPCWEDALYVVQKFLVTRYLWGVSCIWRRIPARLRSLPLLVRYGAHLHSLVLRFVDRRQNHSTFFFRNRAELELIRQLADQASRGSTINMAVIACSKGAEVYSIAFALKDLRPDLTINLRAVDVSQEILEFARRGEYSLQDRDNKSDAVELGTYRDQPPGYSPFKLMSESEKNAMFDRDGDVVRVKSSIKEGITWHCADAGDPELTSILGHQDMIIANRFLCHLKPAAAERILRNISRVVKPGGYLFVSGVDLDVRMRVAMDMKWEAVTELMEEIHEGDPSIRDGWPFDYWAKEPLDARRHDAMIRYASAFKII